MKVQLNNDADQKVRSSRLINLHRKEDELNRAIEQEKARARKILAEQKAAAAARAAIEEAEQRAAGSSASAKSSAVAKSGASASLPARMQASPVTLPRELSVDEIAMAASEAIVAIRTATDPADIAAQLKSLQRFAKLLKENPEMPEMLELSATIEKFVAVAKKSTGAKMEAKQKRAEKAAEQARAEQIKAEQAKAEQEQAEQTTGIKINVGSGTIKTTAQTAKKNMATSGSAIKVTSAAAQKTVRSATTKQQPAKVAVQKARALKVAKPVASKTAATLKSASRKTVRLPLRKSLAKKSTHPVCHEDKLLKQALEQVAAMDDEERAIVRKHHKYDGLKVLVAMTCAILCVVGVVWVVSSNNPDVSVRVAAMQTGVQATYPSYIPRDFTLRDINSENGKITLSFYNSVSGVSFTLVEEKSTWDSAALERNYVKLNYGDNYEVTHDQGVTVYIKGSSAAWVNGGVLYKINADAGILTKKQLRNIVTSM